MWLVYRCDVLSIRDIQNYCEVNVIKAGNFEQRAVHAYCKSMGLMKPKTENKNPTVRVIHIEGDESISSTMEFTAMMHDQSFNSLLVLSDEQVQMLTQKYKELYKARLKEALGAVEAAALIAIDNDDPTFLVDVKPNLNTVQLTAAGFKTSDKLQGLSNLTEKVREDLAQSLNITIEIDVKE